MCSPFNVIPVFRIRFFLHDMLNLRLKFFCTQVFKKVIVRPNSGKFVKISHLYRLEGLQIVRRVVKCKNGK